MEGADSRGAGEPEYASGLYTTILQGPSSPKTVPERRATKKIRKIKEMRPKVSSHLNVGTSTTSVTVADAQKTLNHKMAKRQKQPVHQLRIHPLPRQSRAGLTKCQLTISTIIQFSPTRRNEYEIPAIRNEQKFGAEDLKLEQGEYIHTMATLMAAVAPEWTEEDLSQLTRSMVKFPGGTPGRWEKIAHELGRSVTDVTTKAKQLKDSVTCSPGMVRLSELRSTAQNSRPTKATTALPDDIITQRDDAKQAEGEEDKEDEQEEDDDEPEAVVLESRPRRRRPARPPEATAKVEPEEKVRGKRQKDFDISEQKESSDEESQKKDRTRAAEEPWTQSQQKLLELALQQYPKGSSDRWDKIAKCVPSKSK
ncbi:hypothetical protein GH733_012090, partial [Mirounga leonina]